MQGRRDLLCSWRPPLPGSDGSQTHAQSPLSVVLHEREEQQFLFIHLAQNRV